MKTSIFHTVNSGLYLYGANTGLLIDGLHTGTAMGFSPLPSGIERQLNLHTGLFEHLDGLLFTHLHMDHFDAGYLKTALDTAAPPQVYCGDPAVGLVSYTQILPGVKQFSISNAEVTAFATAHTGPLGNDAIHESFLIRLGAETLFAAGDGALNKTLAAQLSSFTGGAVDAVFLNLYQLYDSRSIDFLHRITPNRVFLYHLPFPEDDRYCYWLQAKQVIRSYPQDLPSLEVLNHMEWIDRRPADWAVAREE